MAKTVTTAVDTCLLLRPYSGLVTRYATQGGDASLDGHLVVEADSPATVDAAVAVCPVAPLPSGFNPYFDLPAA